MAAPRITVLIHTRNEEKWIADCVRSGSWADEIVVADMASTDRTRNLATSLGARVVDVPMVACVDAVRNIAMESCNGDWLLVVDADERVSPGLAAKVRTVIANPDADAYWIPRRNYLFDRWMEHTHWPDHQLRLFRKGAASWSGIVHEPPKVGGSTSSFPADPDAALEHTGGLADLTQWLQKSARYAELELARIPPATESEILIQLLRRPVADFLIRYFGGGWKDGYSGLVHCILMAIYRAMIGVNLYARHRSTLDKQDPGTVRRQVRRESLRTALKLLKP